MMNTELTLEQLPLAERLRVEVLHDAFRDICGAALMKTELYEGWAYAARCFVALERKHGVQIRPCTRSTFERLFYRWRQAGCNRLALVDRRRIAYARKGTAEPAVGLKVRGTRYEVRSEKNGAAEPRGI